MDKCKRIAIVGGGYMGMLAIKAFLEDHLEPVCFEKSSQIGGTWCYRKEADCGTASIMSTTMISQSKEMGSISNCPFPDDSPNYMRHDEVHKHMMNMFKKFDVLKYVTCNREVVRVQRTDDYEETGRWMVTVKNTKTEEITSDIYDAVVVNVGHLTRPVTPDFPGIGDFKGRIMHSHSLKTFESFADERVVVVGTGCSALDAAAEISNIANKVYLSVRTPSWIVSRRGPYGLPIDYVLLRRYMDFIQFILPTSLASVLVEQYYLNTTFDHQLYGINPEHRFLCHDPFVNDALPTKLLAGTVVLRKDISKMEENGVVFDGENELTKVESIIFATGYSWGFPFLEDGIVVQEKKDKILLYKGIFPPQLKHSTLAITGFLLTFGPGFPIGEIQTRWVSYVLSGKGNLPSHKTMMADIDNGYEKNVKRFTPSDKMSLRVDWIPYMDDIASQFGAKPNFWSMAITDPKLFIACIFGPCVSYQYRLEGPHKWEGAREAILTTPKRVKIPLCGSNEVDNINMKENHLLHKMLPLLLVILLFSLNNTSISLYLLLLIVPYFISVGGTYGGVILTGLLIPHLLTHLVFSEIITIFFVLQILVVVIIF